MTIKGVLKILETGETDLNSQDPRKFIVNLPKYPCLKFDQIKTGTLNVNAGDSSGLLDITHNLGLVDFDVYQDGVLWPNDIRAYNDGTKIRIQRILSGPYNRYSWIAPNDLYDAKFGGRNYTCTGKDNDGNGRDHAIKFNNIPIIRGASIVSASLDHYVEYRWVTSPAQNMLLKTYGIDQDDCESFDSYPMSRSRTDAVTEQSNVVPNTGEFFGTNVKNQVQEIINRSGWSSGNDIGFLIFDNGTPAGNYIEDDSARHSLSITVSGTLSSTIYVVFYKDKIA